MYEVQRGILYFTDRAVQCLVEIYACQCNNYTYFDGFSQYIFNYNSKSLFSHQLLNEFTNNFKMLKFWIKILVYFMERAIIENKCEINGWWRKLENRNIFVEKI